MKAIIPVKVTLNSIEYHTCNYVYILFVQFIEVH